MLKSCPESGQYKALFKLLGDSRWKTNLAKLSKNVEPDLLQRVLTWDKRIKKQLVELLNKFHLHVPTELSENLASPSIPPQDPSRYDLYFAVVVFPFRLLNVIAEIFVSNWQSSNLLNAQMEEVEIMIIE